MKYLLLALFLFNSSLAFTKDPLSIYICSRLTPEAREWNDAICQTFEKNVSLFLPQDIDLKSVTKIELDLIAYQKDFEAMNKCDLLLVFPPYGRDCAWEIGWFCGKEKPAIAYIEESGEWLKDAMVKGGLSAIITNNADLHKILLEDPSVSDKSYLITSRQMLSQMISKVYRDWTKKKESGLNKYEAALEVESSSELSCDSTLRLVPLH